MAGLADDCTNDITMLVYFSTSSISIFPLHSNICAMVAKCIL